MAAWKGVTASFPPVLAGWRLALPRVAKQDLPAMDQSLGDRAEALWKVAFAKARRPLSEILIPEEHATRLATEGIRGYMAASSADRSLAEASAWVDRHVRQTTLTFVAQERLAAADPDKYAAEERSNPHLEMLRQEDRDPQEWQKLYDQVKPIAFGLAQRWRKPDQDAEDVLHESLADLTKVSETTGQSLLQRLTVIEEIFPLFSTIVRRKLGKMPGPQPSLDDEEQVLTKDVAPEGVKFLDIYKHCKECVSDFGWRLIFGLFLEGRSREELLTQEDILNALGLEATASKATKFRKLKEELTSGLEKLGPCVRELLGQTLTLTPA